MSKLGCRCGHVIRDQTDYIPHKASFIPDKLDYQILDELDRRINDYKKKISLGETLPDYFLFDYLSGVGMSSRKCIYECVNCGRLWIETQPNFFKAFLSESGQYEAVLDADVEIE